MAIMAVSKPDTYAVICPVCHDDFDDPKILPCTHLVCRKCVVTWLKKGGSQQGCPLCRAPILPSTQSVDLEAQVDALPTDLAIQSVVENQKVLNSPHVCTICDGGKVAASCYCLQCSIKLCQGCSKGHTKIPSCKTHSIEDLDTLTAQRLAEVCRMTCKSHADRLAELYCSSHQELICLLCFPTCHRDCPEVKAVADVAQSKRAELKERAAKLLEKEAELASQIQASRDEFKSIHKKVNDVFDDLEQLLQKRRQAVIHAIQAEEAASMTSLSDMEGDRASLKAHAGTVNNLAESAASDALLGMMGKLTSRLQDMELTVERKGRMSRVVDVSFNDQDLILLGSSISALGEIRKKEQEKSVSALDTTVATFPDHLFALATTPRQSVTVTNATAIPLAVATAPMQRSAVKTTTTAPFEFTPASSLLATQSTSSTILSSKGMSPIRARRRIPANRGGAQGPATPQGAQTSATAQPLAPGKEGTLTAVTKEYATNMKLLSQINAALDPFISDELMKEMRFDLQRAVNIPVNSISPVSRGHLVDKLLRLRSLLKGEAVNVQGKQVAANVVPLGLIFCKNLIAKMLAKKAEEQVSSSHESAFAIAAVTVGLWTEFPNMGKLIMAHLQALCPYVLPIYPARLPSQTSEEYHRTLGYKIVDGNIEQQDMFLRRMSGILRLYAAILVTSPPQDAKYPHPHGLEHAWVWFTRTVNLQPNPDITATAIYDMLQVTGSFLQRAYCVQFAKLLSFLQKSFLPKLKEVAAGSGPVVRLETFLETTMKNNALIPEPEGYLSPRFWQT